MKLPLFSSPLRKVFWLEPHASLIQRTQRLF